VMPDIVAATHVMTMLPTLTWHAVGFVERRAWVRRFGGLV
jgi:hypothetical protein